jgi:hypothetical protein
MNDLFPDGRAVDKDVLRKGLLGPVLNLQGFGAIPDDATDVADAFDRAFAETEARVVVLPPGRYTLKRPVELKRDGLLVSMSGAVIDATDVVGGDYQGVHHLFPVTAAFRLSGRNIVMEGGHLKTGLPRAKVSAGILIDNSRYCTVRNLRVSGDFYASIWPGGGSEDILIDGCTVEDGMQNIVLGFISRSGPQVSRIVLSRVTSSGSGENGLLAHGHVHDLQVLGGVYRNNTKDGIDLFTCAESVTIQGVHCIDNRVKGLDFKYLPEWTGEPGRGAGHVGKVTISGCQLNDNRHAGCSVSISSTDDYPDIGISHFVVEANQAHGNGDHGFYFVMREGVVANNIAKGNGNRGFNFLSCRDVVVSGNQAIDNCMLRQDSSEGFGFNLESNGKRPPANQRLAIIGNIARRNGSAGNQVDGFALHATRIKDSSFIGNVSSGHPRNMVIAGNFRMSR